MLRQILNSLQDVTERVKKLHRATKYEADVSSDYKLTVEAEDFTPKQDYHPRILLDNLSLKSSHFRHAVRVTLDDGSEHPAVASLGVRPTFEPPEELLEAHVFDFDGDLYGRRIEVALHAFIREERKFDGIQQLVAEMKRDEAAARKLLAID